jgi:4-amino-4-deoxy-L-arabinose transferase-like glycosyltransferase
MTPDHPRHDLAPARVPAWLILVLLGAGVLLFAFDSDFRARPQYIVAAGAVVVALAPGVRGALSRGIERLRIPSARVKWMTAALLFTAAVTYLPISALLAERRIFPTYHDEFMYLVQAQLLAHGRLWTSPHPLAEFFDSFFLFTRPVYASAYFPGTALLYVPGVWLAFPPWYTSVLIAALTVALIYLVTTEIVDGAAGLLAALLTLSLEQFRVVSVMTLSHTAMLLLFMLTFLSYLRWRRHRSNVWGLILGVFAGWAAITRPLDAVCLILPLALAMLWELRGNPLRRAAFTLGTVVIGALPFLSLQLVFDRGVTGHWLQTPITAYGQANFPGLTLGFRPHPEATESLSPLPQVRDYYRQFLRDDLRNYGTRAGFIRTWVGQRWKPVVDVVFPAHLFLLLLPLGFIGGLRRPDAWALIAGATLLPFAYTFWPSYLNHYGVVLAPAYILLALLGADVLRRRFPGSGCAIALAVAALAIGSLPELRGTRDHFASAPILLDIDDRLADLDHTPAVVLFRYDSGKTDVHEEPVFNIDSASPDEAAVVRAHDRGPENHRIFEYYANREPRRYFYLYDRARAELTPLGWAKDLAAASIPNPGGH